MRFWAEQVTITLSADNFCEPGDLVKIRGTWLVIKSKTGNQIRVRTLYFWERLLELPLHNLLRDK